MQYMIPNWTQAQKWTVAKDIIKLWNLNMDCLLDNITMNIRSLNGDESIVVI